MARDALHTLADALGLEARWTDADGRLRRVAPEALEALATALGYPAGSAREIADSRARLAAERGSSGLPPLIVATRGRATPLSFRRNARYRIELENGGMREGKLPVNEWTKRCEEWMRQQGNLPKADGAAAEVK